MAFFDDLGKKISHAGQTAVQKTKDMTDIARLNENIAEEEKKINSNYHQIGKLYVAMHTYDYEADFEGMMIAIKEAEAKIQNYRQQVKDIKGIERCEKCGADVASDAAFCSTCGSPLLRKPTVSLENAVKCSACGQMMEADARFCTECGHPMVDMLREDSLKTPMEEEKTPEIPSSEEQEEQDKTALLQIESEEQINDALKQEKDKFCVQCGAELDEGALFCIKCGAKIL